MFILTRLSFRNIWCNFFGRTHSEAYILVYLSSHYILVFNEEKERNSIKWLSICSTLVTHLIKMINIPDTKELNG